MVRRARAGKHARADRRAPERSVRQGTEASRSARPADPAGLQRSRQHAGAVRRAPEGGHRQLEADDRDLEGDAGMRRAYASIASGQVHYAEAGEGPPLLLLHSVPRSARSFRLLQPRLAHAFRTLAPDLPGFGQSDALGGEVTMEALAGAMV